VAGIGLTRVQADGGALTGVRARLGPHERDAEYEVWSHGAHVTRWQPVGGDPVLFLSARARFAVGAGIRGGVPVCFPWFGAGRSGDLTPAHGFARVCDWVELAVDDRTEQEGSLRVTYGLGSGDITNRPDAERFPTEFAAELEVSFSPVQLDVALRVCNVGDRELSYEAALHTYLRTGDAAQVWLTGLEGAPYLDKVAAGTGAEVVRHQEGAVRFTQETDRVYTSDSPVRLHDPVLGRVLEVAKHGSATTVVWNPWVTKAAALPDLGDDEWRSFVCVETANTGSSSVRLAPGQQHEMSTTLTAHAVNNG